MTRNFIWALIIAASMLSSDVRAQDTVLFDFNNDTELDGNADAGTMMSATGATETVVLTSVGVFAPEFEESEEGVFSLTGNTIDATTSIGSGDAIGINNPTIVNGDYETLKGSTSGTESGDMNAGESIVLEFDTDVVVQQLNFSSIDADSGDDDGFFIVEIEGVATPFNFVDGNTGDDFDDPFSGMVITAGTDITFTVGGTSLETNIRISEITVETVGAGGSFPLGDVNRSGEVNFLDISPFIGVLSSGDFQLEADVNEDSTVNFLDISPFISILAG